MRIAGSGATPAPAVSTRVGGPEDKAGCPASCPYGVVGLAGSAAAGLGIVFGHDHTGMVRVGLVERGRPSPLLKGRMKVAGLLDVYGRISRSMDQPDRDGRQRLIGPCQFVHRSAARQRFRAGVAAGDADDGTGPPPIECARVHGGGHRGLAPQRPACKRDPSGVSTECGRVLPDEYGGLAEVGPTTVVGVRPPVRDEAHHTQRRHGPRERRENVPLVGASSVPEQHTR